MKIAPITNNNIKNTNITYKGSVSYKVEELANSYSRTLYNNHLQAYIKPNEFRYLPTMFSVFSNDASDRAKCIIDNLKTIMSRYGKSCQLTYETSEKNPNKHIFMIKSSDSDYVQILNTVKLEKEEYETDLDKLNNFTENFANLNPYEINLKFRAMVHPDTSILTKSDSFAPEKEIWFIEDELKTINTDLSSKFGKDCNPTIAEVWDEINKFKKIFKTDTVLLRS